MSIKGTFARFDDSGYRYGSASRLLVAAKLRIAIKGFAELVERRIKLGMQAPKHGTIYTSVGGKVHVASAPGEPPAVQSGALLASIGIKYSAGGLSADIGVISRTDPPYARRLEVGNNLTTMNILAGRGRNEAARPYIKPVADSVEGEFIAALRVALERI